MDTVFTNSESSETSDRHRLLFNLTDKINLKKSDEYIALSDLRSDKSITSAPKWNEEFGLPDVSCFVSDMQVSFEYIIKDMEKRLIIL